MSTGEPLKETLHSFGGYIDETVRLATFNKWPKSSKKAPETLSHAGFFYRGLGHQVTCFSCGTLWSTSKPVKWRTQTDPWKEHALLTTKCDYLKMVKGSAFIEAVWKEDYELWYKKYEARKKAEKRKAKRDEKKLKAERDEKKMKAEQDEKNMEKAAAA